MTLTHILDRSLAYICAFHGERLAWDGGIHAFILDTTVHPDVLQLGIGSELLKHATAVAHKRGIEWLHVDFEPRLTSVLPASWF